MGVKKVFVQNISPDVPDSFIESILRECGPVTSWKRTKNENDIPVSFGYCTFEHIDGVLNCMRLLNKMVIHNKFLEIKISTKTKDFIAEYTILKKRQIKQREVRRGRHHVGDKEVTELLNLEMGLEDDKARKRINLLLENFDVDEYKKRRERETDKVEPRREREKERERKKIMAAKELQRKFEEKLNWWSKIEIDMKNKREREAFKESNLDKERKRMLEKQLDFDSDEEEKRFKSNPSFARRMVEKAAFRKKEYQEDLAAQKKEADEEKRRQDKKREEERKKKEEMEREMNIEVKKKKEERALENTIKEDLRGATDVVETIRKKRKKKRRRSNEREKSERSSRKKRRRKRGRRSYSSSSEEEEKSQVEEKESSDSSDDGSEKRKKGSQESDKKGKRKKRRERLDEEKIRILKKIRSKVPNKRDDVYNYKVDWELAIENKVIENKVLPWLKKKTFELIGKEETFFINLILRELLAKQSAELIEDKVAKVLAEDAEEFVRNMFRNLIFETLKVRYEID